MLPSLAYVLNPRTLRRVAAASRGRSSHRSADSSTKCSFCPTALPLWGLRPRMSSVGVSHSSWTTKYTTMGILPRYSIITRNTNLNTLLRTTSTSRFMASSFRRLTAGFNAVCIIKVVFLFEQGFSHFPKSIPRES